MSAYTTGSVTIVAGSATITGNGTQWDTYVSPNYIFKLTDEGTTYTVADVVSSTVITLSSRYANSNYQVTRADEHLATVNHASLAYAGITDNTPVIQSTVKVTASAAQWEDNGAGVMATVAGAGLGENGTIDYDSGAWAISFNSTSNVATSISFTASYDNGATANSMPYQIVVDYTTNYDLPEFNVNDANLAHIYTKGIRMVDSTLFNTLASAGVGRYDTIWIPAGAMTPTIASSATASVNDRATNNLTRDILLFSGEILNHSNADIVMPESWDGGLVKAKFYGTIKTDTYAASGNIIEWGIRAGVCANGSPLDRDLSATKTAKNFLATTLGSTLYISDATASLYVKGATACATYGMVHFDFTRNVNGSDNVASDDAVLYGCLIQYKKNETATAW